jgi:hypothetical protein
MREDLLLRLADALEADANNPTGIKFDLRTWAYTPEEGVDDPAGLTTCFEVGEVIPVNCNTAACAMGFAAISGLFAAEGLSYEIKRGVFYPTLDDINDGFKAGAKLFDINSRQSWYLFDPTYYRNEEQTGKAGELAVVNRIREFVKAPQFGEAKYNGKYWDAEEPTQPED